MPFDKQQEFLRQEISLNRLSHAYLFTGEPGAGKEKISEWFIGQLRENQKNGENFYSWRIHPNVSEDNKSQIISIDQIRDIKHRTDLKLGNQEYQVIVIHNAQTMNIYAQDALLKVLEEPKNRTIFILLSNNLNSLRSTISSRCQIVSFPAWGFQGSVDWLIGQGSDQNSAEIIALIGHGCIDYMVELRNHPEMIKDKMLEWQSIQGLQERSLGDRFQIAERLAKQEDISIILEIWLVYWRAALLTHVFKLKIYQNIFPQYDLNRIVNIVEQIEEISSKYRGASLNKRLALEQILISFDYA